MTELSVFSFDHSACSNCPLLLLTQMVYVDITYPPIFLLGSARCRINHVILWVLGTQPGLAVEIQQKMSGEDNAKY